MMVGWARFCAHADTKPRGQTINLSAHPTQNSENKFTLWLIRTKKAKILLAGVLFQFSFKREAIRRSGYACPEPVEAARQLYLAGRTRPFLLY
jgi:hypothetical protein